MKRLLRLATAFNLRILIIVAPVVIACVYLGVFAADRFVSESIIALKANGEGPVGIDGLSALFGGNPSGSSQDEQMLEAHILSMDMLRALDQKLNLRRSFSAPRSDLVYRLSPRASQEEFLDYYRKRVEVIYDEDSRLLRIRTQAFTPEEAYALNREIITLSEAFINESSHRLAREQMAFADAELQKARTQLNAARDALLAFQNEHGVLDPLAEAQANTGLTAELQATLARQEAELKAMRTYLNDNSHQVQGMLAQISATRAQLAAEKKRGIAAEGGARLNVLAGQYQQLLADMQYAQDSYKLALTALESARVESTRKLKSLVLVESPAKPESPEYPRRLYTIVALLLATTLLYSIVRLIVATIEDHQE